MPVVVPDAVKTFVEVTLFLHSLYEASKKVAPKARQLLKRKREDSPAGTRLINRTGLINRERELRAIQAAIEGSALRIVHLTGVGGVGKSRLLEEIEHLIIPKITDGRVVWAGIFDLARAGLHDTLAFQDALLDKLDPEGQTFSQYRKARTQYKQRVKEGIPGLETERKQLEHAFFETYRAFAKERRIVLALDTTESVIFEQDLIQELCQFPAPADEIFEWLLTRAGELPNTAILLAGRPRPALSRRLEQAYARHPGSLEHLPVAGLTRDGSCQLLEKLLEQAPAPVQILSQHADQLWKLTGGLPVQLALLVETAARLQLADWAADQEGDPADWQTRLLDTIFDQERSETRLLFLLALARKGLTADLLHYLEPVWAEDDCRQKLAEIQNWSLVKLRPGEAGIFLHDALYELFDAAYGKDARLQPWYERLSDYYRTQQAQAGGNRAVWREAALAQLYYAFQHDPVQTYEHEYLYWSDLALKGYEIELDIGLQGEMQRMLRNPHLPRQGLTEARFQRDNALRWLKRMLARARPEQAAAIAEALLAYRQEDASARLAGQPQSGLTGEPALRTRVHAAFAKGGPSFWSGVFTYYGESLVYLGQHEQAAAALEQAVVMLTDNAPLSWQIARTAGRANSTLGYLWRGAGQYARAVQAYQKALSYFTAFETTDERAATLNNLAFVLFLLGSLEKAKTCIDQALDSRLRLQQRYPLALSYNTRGRIYALQGYPDWGIRECQLALSMFEELEAPRGIGLACNALGSVLRLKGIGWRSGNIAKKDALAAWRASERHLKRAVSVFSSQVQEPLRLWEARSELGQLYQARGELFLHLQNPAAAQRQFKQAIRQHGRAFQVAQRRQFTYQQADTCIHLAQTCAQAGDAAQAQKWLEQGFSLIPQEFFLTEHTGFDPTLETGQAFWLVLGNAAYQQGLWLLEKGINKTRDYQTVLEKMSVAGAYYQQFSADTPIFQARLQTIADRIRQTNLTKNTAIQYVQNTASRYNIDLGKLIQLLA